MYLSLVTGATLGFGDIVPQAPWLRTAVRCRHLSDSPCSLLRSSWLLQIYPALARRRAVASRLHLLRDAETAPRLSVTETPYTASLLDSLARGLVKVTVDLTEYSETYYFRDSDSRSAMAAVSGYIPQLVEVGRRSSRSDVRLAADLLAGALNDFCAVLRRYLVTMGESAQEILAAYATDHGHKG